MDVEAKIDEVLAKVDKIVEIASNTAQTAPPSKERHLLEAVVARLKKVRAQAAEHTPGHLAFLKGTAEEIRDRAGKLPPKIAAARAEIEKLRAAHKEAVQAATDRLNDPPVPPVPTPPPIDLNLGWQLRSDLLARFAPDIPEQPPPPHGKDIWEDWQ